MVSVLQTITELCYKYFISIDDFSVRILFIGLDNSGKSTLISLLSDKRITIMPPTVIPLTTYLNIDNMFIMAREIGGWSRIRSWNDHLDQYDGIVFNVDASDKERYTEARHELSKILNNDQLSKTPILILGNKTDKRGVPEERKFREALGITKTSGKIFRKTKQRPMEVFMCSAVKREGCEKAIKWLCKYL